MKKVMVTLSNGVKAKLDGMEKLSTELKKELSYYFHLRKDDKLKFLFGRIVLNFDGDYVVEVTRDKNGGYRVTGIEKVA